MTMSILFRSTNAATVAFGTTNSSAGRTALQRKTVEAYNKAVTRVGRSMVRRLNNATLADSQTHVVELRSVPVKGREDWTWLYVATLVGVMFSLMMILCLKSAS